MRETRRCTQPVGPVDRPCLFSRFWMNAELSRVQQLLLPCVCYNNYGDASPSALASSPRVLGAVKTAKYYSQKSLSKTHTLSDAVLTIVDIDISLQHAIYISSFLVRLSYPRLWHPAVFIYSIRVPSYHHAKRYILV